MFYNLVTCFQVGDHTLLVEVTNRHGTADGEVLLKVLPSAADAPTDTSTNTPAPVTHDVTTKRNDVRPTFIAIIKSKLQ